MDPALEQRTLDAEDRHWWYRGRRAIVLDAVGRALRADGRGLRRGHGGEGGGPADSGPRILDAGCGGGATLAALAGAQPGAGLAGLEPSPRSRERAIARDVAEIVDGSILELPFGDDTFDLALCLDVIEHLDDDAGALAELRRVVRPGGGLVVTVPAHPRMWSRHDELNHHRRRYTRRSLRAVAESAGWEQVKATHFNSILLPVAVLARRFSDDDGLTIPPAPLNRALEATLHAERIAIRAGLRLPFGLSLLAEFDVGAT